jgi:hypothetical protein
MSWRAQYGKCDILRYTGGVSRIWQSPRYHLFICISALVQLISYQLCNLLLSFEFKNYILETNSHCTPEILIYAVGDLATSNLTLLSSLTCLPASNPRGQHENFFFGFIFRLDIEGLLVLGCCTPLYVALWILHVSHAFQGSDEQNLLSFVGCSQGSDSKISVAIPPSLSIQVSWMEVYSEIYEKVCRVIVNRCYERHKEIRSLDIHCVLWFIRRTMITHRAPGEQKSCCRIFGGNFWLTGSSVGIATDYGLDGLGSNPGGDEIFRPTRLSLGPTQPPVN